MVHALILKKHFFSLVGARAPSARAFYCVRCPAAAMAAPGGGKSPPYPSIFDEDAFRRLLSIARKKLVAPQIPKFIKKLDAIPEIVLPEEKPIKIALALAKRGLVGQFMGLWPSTRTTDDWIQRNWRPQLKHSVTCYPVGRGFYIFEFISKDD